jgi:hypothetical protein
MADVEGNDQADLEIFMIEANNERIRHETLGYTHEHDAEMGVDHLLHQAIRYAMYGRVIESASLILAAEDLLHYPKEQSNLVDHATRELELVGEDEIIVKGYLAMIQIFADMGHSGYSGAYFIQVLTRLLNFENLKPLTANPKEWNKVGEDLWQSSRNGEAFSNDGGLTYWLLSERKKGGKRGPTHRSEHVSGVHPSATRRKGDK